VSTDPLLNIIRRIHSMRFPRLRQLRNLPAALGVRERLLLFLGTLLLVVGAGMIGFDQYDRATVIVPGVGGTYVEGLLGEPRFVNPLYASTNDVDADLVQLLYAGLFRVNAQGAIVPDLTEKYTVSDDGKTITVTLADNLRWHDGAQITASDVTFTIQLIQDPTTASPLRGSFRGVEVERIDDVTVRFITERPLAVFLSALTVGILPSHLWVDVPPTHLPLAELNLRPIGSGPFKFAELTKDPNGTVRSYSIERFETKDRLVPLLNRMTFRFFSDVPSMQDALKNREIDGLGTLQPATSNATTDNGRPDVVAYTAQLSQTTAVFLNQKRNEILKDVAVRTALSESIDRAALIATGLDGAAVIIGGPIIPGFSDTALPPHADTYNVEAAAQRLDAAKWERIDVADYISRRTKSKLVALEIAKKKAGTKTSELAATDEERVEVEAAVAAELDPTQPYYRVHKDSGAPLILTLVVPDSAELSSLGNAIQRAWQAIGVRTIVELVPLESVRGERIPERAYDALLFSQILGPDPDPFPFWHSSQVRHPGLNLSYYSNKGIDEVLEVARRTLDHEARGVKYSEFQELIAEARPAIFLFSPKFAYVLTNAVRGVSLSTLTRPSDRFATVTDWYISTERKWKR
jgi:peptide/nickel transport system substrate-binding protein